MGKQLASCLAGCLAMTLAMVMATPSLAAQSALMQAPARNAAVIAKVPGFKSANLDLYIGKREITEGLVIRKSRIENGKIIIPPAGMYFSSRIGSIGTMTGIEMMILGKRYAEVNELYQYIVLKDRKMKLGDSINLLPDGSRALQFVGGKGHPYGNIADSATLRIMKASGNFYGAEFTVAVHPTLKNTNSSDFTGIGKPEGHYLVDTNSDLNHNTYVGASVYPSGQSYLMVNKNTAKEMDVKEFVTPSLTKLWLSASPRISGEYAKGDVVKLGKGKVEVVAVSPETVKLRLVDAQGRTLERSFDNLNAPNALDYLPSSPMDRAKYQMASSDDTLHVQLAMLKPGGPVTGDKVQLDLFSDVFTIGNPQPWPGDTRFLARPDTWASCGELNEILLENAEEVVLDSANNVFVGPEGYFKVVIDEFDGKNVKAWHFEDAEGNKSVNLAVFARGQHIDLLANIACSTVGTFATRNVIKMIENEQQAKGLIMQK